MPPAVMLRRGTLLAATAMLSGLMLPSASAAPKDISGLDWRPCTTVAKDWPIPGDTRTECAELRVPLDYSKPQGRKISLAVSRIKADGPGRKAEPLLYGPGGPGVSNLASPARVLETGLRPLAANRDILGIDDRGTGYSDRIDCDAGPGVDVPATAGPRERAKAAFDEYAEFNKRCAAKDPEFVRQLTPANAARDIDSFRQALGASKIDLYGVSFSTAVGMAYRSLFDDRVPPHVAGLGDAARVRPFRDGWRHRGSWRRHRQLRPLAGPARRGVSPGHGQGRHCEAADRAA
ncbi:alpha/beta fold hydrolase [Streptomyces mirabilis]|uniref:alpha/beta fold hydrolase n=1 Tax=Streptomyces mirabilis TaxID=68239 RepID=UPI002F91A4A9